MPEELKKECKHSLIVDKNKDFAYCEKCLVCIKNGKIMSKDEYIATTQSSEELKKSVNTEL